MLEQPLWVRQFDFCVGKMIESGTQQVWISRPVHALPWFHVHVTIWLAYQWRQLYETHYICDDYGVLVPAPNYEMPRIKHQSTWPPVPA